MTDWTIGGLILTTMVEFGDMWLIRYYNAIAGEMGRLLSLGFAYT